MDTKEYVVLVQFHGVNLDYTIHHSIVRGLESAIMVYLDLYRKWGAVKGTEGSLSEYGTEDSPIEDWYTSNIYSVAYKCK